jgi:hypothetical protein
VGVWVGKSLEAIAQLHEFVTSPYLRWMAFMAAYLTWAQADYNVDRVWFVVS